MAVYKNITSGTTTVLVEKGGAQHGRFMKMLISNNNSSTATGVCVDYYDGTNVYYIIRDTKIPSGATLVIEDNLAFNSSKYNLRISHDSGSGNPNLTVILK